MAVAAAVARCAGHNRSAQSDVNTAPPVAEQVCGNFAKQNSTDGESKAASAYPRRGVEAAVNNR